jgi:hypothetical protein
MPWANWRATVYHGLPDDLYHFHPEPGGCLAFLGRICPEKRVAGWIAWRPATDWLPPWATSLWRRPRLS